MNRLFNDRAGVREGSAIGPRARWMTWLCAGGFAAALGGCQKDLPGLSIRLAQNTDPACATPASDEAIRKLSDAGDKVRVSIRVHNADGSAPATGAICDVMLSDPRQPFSLKVPVGGILDLFAEAFSPASAGKLIRVASGSLYGLSISKDSPASTYPTLRLYPAEDYTCASGGAGGGGRLSKQRAFHTATLLPNGQVLFIGGARTSSDESSEAAPAKNLESYFATGSIEWYDPVAGTFGTVTGTLAQPRALHHVAIVAKQGENLVLLVLGGVTPTTPGSAILQSAVASPRPVPSGFRFSPTSDSQSATAELLVYDPVHHTAIAGDVPGAMLQSHASAFEGAAPLVEGGMAWAGGIQFAKGNLVEQNRIAVTHDGKQDTSVVLAEARSGAALAPLPTTTSVTTSALLIGGATAAPVMMGGMATPESPFERVDLTGPSSVPANSAGNFPSYLFPTVTLLDPIVTGATTRFLVSGGLEIDMARNALQPPSRTLQVVTYRAGADPLVVDPVVGSPGLSIADTCGVGADRYRPTAFNAATLIAGPDSAVAPDRVLVTGGTAHLMRSGCSDCPTGDDTFACALDQSVVVSVPSTGAGVATSAGKLLVPRFGHTQTQLSDGNVLIVGGFTRKATQDGSGIGTFGVLPAEIWNPARRTPPTGLTTRGGSAVVDADDPMGADLRSASLVREPGAQAHLAGDATPRITCAGLQ